MVNFTHNSMISLVNWSCLSKIIPESPTYGVLSQLIGFARIC